METITTNQQNPKTASSGQSTYRPNRAGQWIKAILVITVFFMLSFHCMPDHGHIFPKQQLSFTNTFISHSEIDKLIERHNQASRFERALIRQEYLYRELKERGVIVSEGDDD